MNYIRIFFDGACWNKKDESSAMGIGVAVFIDKEYNADVSRAIFAHDPNERGTNNVAEWKACVEAMSIAVDLRVHYPDANIMVFSDSQIIANQYNGSYQINGPLFKKYYDKAIALGKLARVPVVNWIPREHNEKADLLSKVGLHGEQYLITKKKTHGKPSLSPDDSLIKAKSKKAQYKSL